jgi:class 3 adenylate cyclase/tetratricopeptide (TPR) repeat protein
MDVGDWLRGLGLERYEQAFHDNDIDAGVLPRLTADDLIAIGVTSVGHRRKLLDAIASLSATTEPAEDVVLPAAAERQVAQAVEAERRQLTVMFIDLVGSTELAAQLDPEDMNRVIRAYQECCAGMVERWSGHVAKYMGDGVLAYFGWPRAHEDAAERAVRAGLAIAGGLAGLETPAGVPLAARIGIATGLVMVGELIGEGVAQEQTVVGETPNLAARLQALATPGKIVVSHMTRRLVGGLFEVTDLGPVRLKGFAEPLAAWLVEGEARTEGRFEALHGSVLTPLVGREHILALLLERWERVKDREGQVILLSGEAGIGKSRIAQSLRERLSVHSCRALRYDCSPYHQNSVLRPFITQLESAAGLAVDDSPSVKLEKLEHLLASLAANVQEVAPLIAALLSIPAGDRYLPTNLTPQRQKEKALLALANHFEVMAAAQPVLLIVEDAHWLDATSLELLDLVVHRLKDLPILLLITLRPEFSPPWIDQGHVTSLLVNRLSRRQAADLVARVAGDNPLSPETANHIVTRAEGIPLFIEELTRAVLSGALSSRGIAKGQAETHPSAAVPATLHDSLMARLDRVPAAKQVAQIGAVIGREFSYEVLAALASLPESTLQDALHQLIDSQIVFSRGTIPNAVLTFKHALVQDAAYESLLRSKRQNLHATAALILEQRFPHLAESEPELLAHHYEQAGIAERAIAYYHNAARNAANRSAHMEAIGHLKKAVNIVAMLPDGSERDRYELSIMLALGISLQDVEGPASPETEKVYVRARELSLRTGSMHERFAALWGLWRTYNTRNDFESALTLAAELLRLAQEEKEPALLLQAHHALWANEYEVGSLQVILKHVAAGLPLYDEREHRSETYLLSGHDPGVCALGSKADAIWQLGFPGQAAKSADDSLALARKLDHPSSLCQALSNAVELYLLARLPSRLRDLCEELIELAKEQGFALHMASATFGFGWALATQGDSKGGIECMLRGLADARDTRKKTVGRYHQSLLAETYCRIGSCQAAVKIMDEELGGALDPEAKHYRSACEIHRLSGEVLLTVSPDEHSRAQSCFYRAIDIAREKFAKSLELRAAMSLGRLWEGQGRAMDAYNLVVPVYDWFTEGFDTPDLVEARILLKSLARGRAGSQIPGEQS